MSCKDLDRKLHASVLKREAVKEREWREARKREEDEQASLLGAGGTQMSKEELRKVIDSDKRIYYRTEELNDKLFIHYKGWRALQGLEGWTGLKALYAECNAFDRIQGLQCCRGLRSLFLQENCIHRIEGLENCPDLWNINLSNNFIERIEGLSNLRCLNTLTLAKNRLGIHGVEDMLELVDTTVTSLDVQDNQISDPDVLPEVFMRMKELRVLYLKGNPCTKKIPNYRKNITVCCEELRYLDDRPVFPEDRRAADAFNRGGLEEERAERRRIKEENTAKHERNMKAFNDMIQNARAEKRERDAMRSEDKFSDETDPVETQEKRMKRQVEQWKEANADDLRDDDKERAERCLKQEREQQKAAAEREKAAGKDASKEAPEDTDAQDTEAGNAPEEADASKEPEEDGKKVDKRKLVYEDIWDDVPTASSPSSPAPSGPSARAAAPAAVSGPSAVGATRPGPLSAAPATADVFLPWATGEGVAGMDSVAPSGAELARRAAELRAAAEERPRQPRSGAARQDGSGPAWYSKFAEKSQGAQEAPPTPAPAASPARTSEAAPPQCSELDEMD
uniref:Dynein assembly factor 1, axonemal homolog n=1 Tax=Alexandrium catenella TaxID=2925 RepID=A0A6T9U9L4_ALECA|mmetsp:Transcript_80270/g.213025  ORF Transcript_80270/g.213025 Transcript_80270/m.213025 type:complete len:566 (+) Transcript_80270:35-1732(+)|eukprot:CAMPEP_0171196460 /NCGR_PEP_ID=MMETSP0790-20130122/21915_1 /TAXON_ID=2925 /ORGANISM="Alexandrium catenella, Strain OF101" /LENGTH=565 /DNA_ID=CAMNT_0011661687 /DNA_START=57 /DNA_END=1754 /DNA_ORIENTATION=-